jgi:hypothetical protein
MRTLIITILILSASAAKAQTNSYRIGELEKWRTQAKATFVWLMKEKTKDSLTIVTLRDSLSKFKPIVFPDARVVNGTKIDTVYTKPQ